MEVLTVFKLNMSKIFWIVAALELAIIAWLYKSTLNMETQSGGREITQFIYVVMPGVLLLVAVVLFSLFPSRIPRYVAMAIVLAPPVLLAYSLVRRAPVVSATTGFVGRSVSASSPGQFVKSAFVLIPAFVFGHTSAKGMLNDVQLEVLAVQQFRGADQRSLGRAIVTGDLARARQLSGTTKLNEVDDQGLITLLDVALRQQGTVAADMVEVLLAAGADPNLIGENSDTTPLIAAVRSGRLGVFRSLLQHGADPNRKTKSGEVSYHAAFADSVDDEYLMLALDHGADVNAVSPIGRTILILAAISDRTQAISVLLDRGADVTRIDAEGKTALDYLVEVIRRSQSSAQDVREEEKLASRLRAGVPHS